VFAVFQEDGTATFLSDYNIVFSVRINETIAGTAYQLVSAAAPERVTLMTANKTHAYLLDCTRTSKACHHTGLATRIYLSSANPRVMELRTVDSDEVNGHPNLFALVTADTVICVQWIKSPHQSLLVLGEQSWSPIESVRVTGVSGISLSSPILMIGLVNKEEGTKPGIVLKFNWNNGRLGTPPLITYMTMSPFNFRPSVNIDQHYAPKVRYWTQQNSTSHTAFVNSISFPRGLSSVAAHMYLSGGSVVSPTCIGEFNHPNSFYSKIGMMAVGNPDVFSWTKQCLLIANSNNDHPAVTLTKSTTYTGLSLPVLCAQNDLQWAYMPFVAKSKDGYAVSFVDFSDCPRSWFAESTTTTLATSEKEKGKRNDFPEKLFLPNCRASTCNIDALGDCQPEKCWGMGAIGGFLCCKHPPT
jgi:hypothetical protein